MRFHWKSEYAAGLFTNSHARIAPQTAKAVSDGFCILLEPLPPESHRIHFKVAPSDPTAIRTMNFALGVRYLLTVIGGQTEVVIPRENFNNQLIPLQNSSTYD